jgi:hypothetical protein
MHVLCELKIKYINHEYSLWFGLEEVARYREKHYFFLSLMTSKMKKKSFNFSLFFIFIPLRNMFKSFIKTIFFSTILIMTIQYIPHINVN